jgi:hypothetical protein
MERKKMRMSRCSKLTGRTGKLVEIRSGAVDCGLWAVEGSRESRVGGEFFRSEKPEWRSERAVRPKEA